MSAGLLSSLAPILSHCSRPCVIFLFLAALVVSFSCFRVVHVLPLASSVDDAPLLAGDAPTGKEIPFESPSGSGSTSRSRTHTPTPTPTSTGIRIPNPLLRFLSLPSIRDARGSVAAARASHGRVGCDGCGQRCGGARGRHGQASGRLRTATVREINNKEEGNGASEGGEGKGGCG